VNGEADITWPGSSLYSVKTSGTTAGDKCILVTREALASHRRGGWDQFYLAVEKAGDAHLLGGHLLILGGSSALAPLGHWCQLGDLSSLAVRRLSGTVRCRYSPGPDLGAISDWERRLAAVAASTMQQDPRLWSNL
jgi:hypothetical protein